jgi:UDP-N-acetylglucosamine/UDP-N-acetylgalactosamine diphosphorylase
MPADLLLADLRRRLEAYDQLHLLVHWDRLSPAQRERFATQIGDVDFDALRRLVRGEKKAEDWGALAARAVSPPAVRWGKPANFNGKTYDRGAARRRGKEALRAGEIGALLVAGGQGTRLGFDQPKGMYSIGPVSGASLFQILFEKLLAVGRRFGVRIPLFLMTSPATHGETLAYLAEHDRFGLADDDLVVFCQGTMPAVDEKTGRLLMSGPGELALGPDGHGGMLAALEKSAAPELIARRRLKQIFYFQVDNPLVQVCDPEFIGFHLLAGSQVSTQVVAKSDPAEKVGVLAEIDGRTRIIEYSDLPQKDAERRTVGGSLELWAGNIAVHVFDVDFLNRTAATAGGLPFHTARKKVPYIDESGKLVEPAETNALKFEKFIFDLLPAAERTLVVEVAAAEAFAPVKNAPGSKTDSPGTARAAMIARHTAWLEKAGVKVVAETPVEISPLWALDETDVAARITPGTVVDRPTYFSA